MKIKTKRGGFTLIEILVVIGIIAILAAIVLIAINPARQFAQARNTQRQSDVTAILNAIGQNIADNRGIFTCSGATIDSTARTITDDSAISSRVDLRPCLVTAAASYISELPVDPSNGEAWDGTGYNTKYTVKKDSTTGRITVAAAPNADLGESISVTR